MPYKFQSRATADLIMLDATAQRLLSILGKGDGRPGIITLAQIPGAIAALEQAVHSEEAQRAAAGKGQEDADASEEGDDDAPASPRDSVSLRQRAAPFIDMLKRSAAEGRDVTW